MRVRARAGGRASWRSAGREGRAGELQVSTKAEETDDGRERSGKPTPRTDAYGRVARPRSHPVAPRTRTAERAASPSSNIHGCARNSFT